MSPGLDLDGGVTSPRGFRAAGVACGIKRAPAPPAPAPLDLALLVADGPASAAAVFTTNKATAAPITVSRDHLTRAGGQARAIVVNSGCANACTGEAGLQVAATMAAATASAVGCMPEQVLVASTGVIGVQLDAAKVTRGVTAAASALGTDGGSAAACAIMTTDPFAKSCAAEVSAGGGVFRVGGMAKGSGMIEPRMATMLAFLTTDAQVEPGVLASALRRVVDESFNAITVDGECSTNDCVFLLASGQSGVRVTRDDDPALLEGLRAVAGHLAREIVRGGEGATKLVTVHVTGAQSAPDAWLAARTIANSPLVKTAIHGGDPNWGRLVAAAGRSGAAFVLERASVAIGAVPLFVAGTPHDERAGQAARVLDAPTVTVTVDLGTGGAHDATMWTCDFSAEYVRINAEYRT
ncbi:MAG TPA: bifunctional glutamate N-acetyltransferase/amino-acid acetyltransferase ArgJ [Vicinamibacterales bacterium]|nr:bifunctional glutamate N-acetyltransferase/amino-acid acetyltransferase ArgJ [Vicinamibacterales bacterium]